VQPAHAIFRRSACGLFAAALLAGVASGQTAPRAADNAELLVVVPDALREALADYVAYRRAQMSVSAESLEEILRATDGADDPERLKRHLYEAWRSRGTRYVLLVGDADVLPVRYMVLDRVTPAAFDYAFYPSDLYYADVAERDGSFEDWNARRDGIHARYYGEVRGEKNKQDPINYDDVDYLPELAVGRWPVSTADEVRTVVRKTIGYEESQDKDPGGTPGPPGALGARRAAIVVVDGWVDGRARMERLAEKLPKGWSSERRFYHDAKQEGDPPTPPPTEAEMLKLMNDGVGLVVHVGHGTDDSWAECFHVKSLGKVQNADRLPIMISAGCSTARFATLPPYEAYVDVEGDAHAGTDKGEVFTSPPPPPSAWPSGKYNPSGLGERLLREGPTGAVAYIGCNTGGQPCGITLLEGFVESLGSAASPRLGDCWKDAVAHYYRAEKLAELRPTESWYPASIFFQGMKYMLFGDPALRIPSGA